jgi:hypothetical protein
MNSDKRNHERKNLASDQIQGKFAIITNEERIEFDKVNDVSISGMGLGVDHSLGENSPLQVSYESEDLNILINAKIIWQEKVDSGFHVGIEFSNENVDSNVMLFMAMREYIDDFGEIL